MAFCSAPGIRKKHSNAQSRGGAFGGDWKQCGMRPMNCTMRLYSVRKCRRSHNGSCPRGVTRGWLALAEERRCGGPGSPPTKQPLATPGGGTPVVALRPALTLRDFASEPRPGYPLGRERCGTRRVAYSATVMASLTLG